MDHSQREIQPGTVATLCSGGEGFGLGAEAAGLRLLWGVEKEPEIAAVAERNLAHVLLIVANIITVDFSNLPRPEFLHASPPCPNFSKAKTGARESELDIALAQAVAGAIEALLPRVFTLENVWLYRRSASWAIIRDTLYGCGYWLDVAHVNAADFGVPQTRKRMIVRAVRGAMVPYLPPPEPWVGWYEAIEDLIPGLEDTEFAPWQLARMPDELRETVLLSQGISRDQEGNEYGVTMRKAQEPGFTVTANWNQNGIRAFLTSGQYGQPNDVEDRPPQIRYAEQPANTVLASGKLDWRGFIVSNAATEFGDGRRGDTDPAFAVTGQSAGRVKAFIVDLFNTSREFTVSPDGEPFVTVCASHQRRPITTPLAYLPSGRIVRINTRCLARWQTFPDWYELPESVRLASTIIGNAVPPLLAEKIVRQLKQ